MRLALRHRWDLTPAQAIALQRRLAARVVTVDDAAPPRRVAGIDVGFEDGGATTRAAVVVLGLPGLELLDSAVARRPTAFPYVPGLLSFRELPAVLDALRRLSVWPDLVLCDGQGLAHPRRFGIACHLGVLLDLPAIGVAKSLLTGRHAPLPPERGRWRALRDGEEVVGAALRTRDGVAPVYVSIGHRVSLRAALRHVLACTPRFRLPQTTRLAHHLASVAGRTAR